MISAGAISFDTETNSDPFWWGGRGTMLVVAKFIWNRIYTGTVDQLSPSAISLPMLAYISNIRQIEITWEYAFELREEFKSIITTFRAQLFKESLNYPWVIAILEVKSFTVARFVNSSVVQAGFVGPICYPCLTRIKEWLSARMCRCQSGWNVFDSFPWLKYWYFCHWLCDPPPFTEGADIDYALWSLPAVGMVSLG